MSGHTICQRLKAGEKRLVSYKKRRLSEASDRKLQHKFVLALHRRLHATIERAQKPHRPAAEGFLLADAWVTNVKSLLVTAMQGTEPLHRMPPLADLVVGTATSAFDLAGGPTRQFHVCGRLLHCHLGLSRQQP